MENNLSSKLVKQPISLLTSSKQSKIIGRFYVQFPEMLSRKTEAEKRIGLYSKDPFK